MLVRTLTASCPSAAVSPTLPGLPSDRKTPRRLLNDHLSGRADRPSPAHRNGSVIPSIHRDDPVGRVHRKPGVTPSGRLVDVVKGGREKLGTGTRDRGENSPYLVGGADCRGVPLDVGDDCPNHVLGHLA